MKRYPKNAFLTLYGLHSYNDPYPYCCFIYDLFDKKYLVKPPIIPESYRKQQYRKPYQEPIIPFEKFEVLFFGINSVNVQYVSTLIFYWLYMFRDNWRSNLRIQENILHKFVILQKMKCWFVLTWVELLLHKIWNIFTHKTTKRATCMKLACCIVLNWEFL